MSYRKKPYEFHCEEKDGRRHIRARFFDYQHRPQEVEITEELHLELTLLNRSVRNIESAEERHNELCDLSEEEHAQRGMRFNPSAEDEVLKNLLIEQLKSAFLELPTTQARRYLLAHGCGYTYAEIAAMEGCSIQAVNKSLVAAKKKIQGILRNRVIEDPSEFGSK
jgi:RNA polymerase sigma-70 factor (ECF subfamily)